MRISLNWIKDFVDITNTDKKELAEKITNAGVNIEGIYECSLNNLVIGLVLNVEKHPDSDHLNICQVDIGSEVLQIVCGASNVKKGIKVIVAKVGATLPGDFIIKKCSIRGIESCGMICALFELGIEDKTDDNYAKGIHILDNSAPIGENVVKYLGLDDIIYDLDLNPNRSDCTNHLGFAYEVAANTNKKVMMPKTSFKEEKDTIKNFLTLEVETNNCPLYLAKMVKNVKVGPSPEFIKNRLESCGIRSINNVVDISNYVMLEYGQPLHFFDRFKIGDKIVVRMAKDDEEVITLDCMKRKLTKEDIVITTGGKDVIAIAGVMGALNSDIDDKTTDIVIESAVFNPMNIRYTSLRLNLKSESSLRFEKGMVYDYTYEAMNRACYLLEKYAGGHVLKDTISYENYKKETKHASVTLDKINSVLGINVPIKEVEKAFKKLGFSYTMKDNEFEVTIPNRRLDVSITEDLIEEVGRLYGFDKIKNKALVLPIKKGSYEPFTLFRKQISKRLRSLGLNEVKTYTLISEKENDEFNNCDNLNSLKLLMPMSLDKSIIRNSLISSLYKTFKYNEAHSVENINIYEISNVYDKTYSEELKLGILMKGNYIESTWQDNSVPVNFFILKGIIENLLNYLGYSNRYRFSRELVIKEIHPGVSASIFLDNEYIGYLGKISPLFDKADIFVSELLLTKIFNKKGSKQKYIEISKYPTIKKDVAFIVGDDVTAEEIINIIKKAGKPLLNDIKIFDLYKGENIKEDKKSIAFSLTFGDNDKTLTDDEVDIVFKKIINEVTKMINASVRDK